MLDHETRELLTGILAGQKAIHGQLTSLQTAVKRILRMVDNIDTEIATETAEEAALADAVTANTAALAQVRTDLAAALAAAKTAGLTPDQVAAFQAIHDKVAADVAAIKAADAPAA